MENLCLEKGMVLKNRYYIRKILGIGGFGITYLAEDRNLGQNIVIKEYYPREIAGRMMEEDGVMNVIPRERNDRRRFLKGKKDFLAEARRMSKLFDIPEVVKILDWFEENGTAYLAMESIWMIICKIRMCLSLFSRPGRCWSLWQRLSKKFIKWELFIVI